MANDDWKDIRVLFTLLSVMNRYGRVVVGDSTGEIFTLGYSAWQKLVAEKAFTTALSGGQIRFVRPWHVEVIVDVPLDPDLPEPLGISFWSEPLLDLGIVCAWDSVGGQWYIWAPRKLEAPE